MAILSKNTWKRHANPWSGWTRVLAMPVIAVGLYLQSYWILGLAVVWLIVNPLIFPKPKSTNNWMSRGVLGEEKYYADGKKLKRDLPTLLNSINVPVFIAFIYFGWTGQLIPLILSGLLVMTLKFWFIDRMNLLVK
ncbi:MAG: DUF6653 family protein [Candidatus Paceibacterota bacterium]